MRSRGEASQERLAQEEREKTALGALYMSVAQIPDSPAEPPVIILDDQIDSTVRHMITGPDVDSIFWSGPPPSEASAAAFHSDQYNGPGEMGMEEDPNKPFPQMDPNMLSAMSAGLGNMTPEQLTQLLATLASQNETYGQQREQSGGHGQQVPPYGNIGNDTGQQDWNAGHQQWVDYGGYQQEDGGDIHQQQNQQHQPSQRGGWDRGFRGRGRGRGRGLIGDGFKDSRKRKPCTFFAQGRQVYCVVSFLRRRLLIECLYPTGVDMETNATSVTRLIEDPRIICCLFATPGTSSWCPALVLCPLCIVTYTSHLHTSHVTEPLI